MYIYSSIIIRMLVACLESELRSCVKVEVVVLGSPSLIVLQVSGCKATFEVERLVTSRAV